MTSEETQESDSQEEQTQFYMKKGHPKGLGKGLGKGKGKVRKASGLLGTVVETMFLYITQVELLCPYRPFLEVHVVRC